MTTLRVDVGLTVVAKLTGTAADLAATPVKPLDWRKPAVLRQGTGTGQATLIYSDAATLAASGSSNIDLSGTLPDGIGGTVALTNVKGLFVYASVNNTHDVVLGAASPNPWTALLGATGTVTLKPGWTHALYTQDGVGYPVVAGTGDILKIANGGAVSSVDYEIILIGT